jgi:hypothetical protein
MRSTAMERGALSRPDREEVEVERLFGVEVIEAASVAGLTGSAVVGR